MTKKTFTQLKKSMTLRDFNKYCWTIAADYGRTEYDIARTYFTETYNIGEKCFRKILDYAVINYLVTDLVVDKMERKATENQRRRSRSSGTSSYFHYLRLRDARRQFIHDLAEEYVERTDVELDYFLDKYGRGEEGFRYILERALDRASYYGITGEMPQAIRIHMYVDFVLAKESCSEGN